MAVSAGSKKDKEHKTILAENEAVNRMLNDWQRLPGHIFGGVLIIDNRIMAFALGERLDDDTIAVHFEKASYAYRGAYAAINRIMLENIGSNYRFVNREQDLGIEGLRKVKLEYNPVRFIKNTALPPNTERKRDGIHQTDADCPGSVIPLAGAQMYLLPD